MNNVIYMFGCVNCTLTIKGKVNSIFMDSCRKSSVVFDTVVSSIEFVNCQSAQMQVFEFIHFYMVFFSSFSRCLNCLLLGKIIMFCAYQFIIMCCKVTNETYLIVLLFVDDPSS